MKSMFRSTVLGLCPACGRGAMFRSAFQLEQVCPACGVRFERGRGEWTGPIVIGYGVGSLVAFWFWVYLFATDRLFPGADLVIFGIAVASILVTYRPAKAWWIWLIHAAGLVYRDGDGPDEVLPVSRD